MRKWMAGLVLLVGCASAGLDAGGGPDTWPGTYDLGSINGSALPYLVSSFGTTAFTITSGGMLLDGKGSFSATIEQTNVDGLGVKTISIHASAGTWSAAGDSLKLFTPGGIFLRGPVVRDAVALTDNAGVVYAYVKRR